MLSIFFPCTSYWSAQLLTFAGSESKMSSFSLFFETEKIFMAGKSHVRGVAEIYPVLYVRQLSHDDDMVLFVVQKS